MNVPLPIIARVYARTAIAHQSETIMGGREREWVIGARAKITLYQYHLRLKSIGKYQDKLTHIL